MISIVQNDKKEQTNNELFDDNYLQEEGKNKETVWLSVVQNKKNKKKEKKNNEQFDKEKEKLNLVVMTMVEVKKNNENLFIIDLHLMKLVK